MRLFSDAPFGRPSLELSEDQIATVIGLLCDGIEEARKFISPGMLEVPITLHLKKAMRRIKKDLDLDNLEISGEFELLDMSNDEAEVIGRIDVIFRFPQHFGDENAYLGVECKRVGHRKYDLNTRYVTNGVDRFATGQYAKGHPFGIMLGYAIKLPIEGVVSGISKRMQDDYGISAKLTPFDTVSKPSALVMGTNLLHQGADNHIIRLVHIFVDMTPAAV